MFSLQIINEKKAKNDIALLKELFNFVASQKAWKNLKGEFNLIFLDNPEIQKLNFQYRKKNTSTDVLSFPYLEIEEIELNQDENLVIGEIFVSLEKVKENALLYKKTFKEELCTIFVHGFLHILGYDHIDDNEFLVMEKKEKLLFKSFWEEIYGE